MSRPTDWSPLAGSDPVPGDPPQVSRTATRCRDTADEILQQVRQLRRLATADGWEAEAADVFREGANEAADKLEQAHGRYAEVAGALDSYSPELDDAQLDSLRALREAQAAEADARAAEASRPGELPPDATDEQASQHEDAVRRAEDAAGAADDRLDAARRILNAAVEIRDSAADSAARRIRDVIDDDGLKDSRWERFKNWVHDNSGWISAVAEIASWVATALVVIALFIPGVNLLVWAAIGLTLLALAAHSLLASTGNGSWVDVAIDVFALLTFGTGRLLASGSRAATATARGTAATAAGRAATRTAMAGSSAQRTALGRVLSSRTASAGARRSARAQIEGLKRAAGRTGRQARQTALRAPLPTATPAQRLILGGGEDEIARALLNARAVMANFPAVPRVQQAASAAAAAANRARVAYGSGVVVDLADKVNVFDPLKDMPAFRYEFGSTW